MTIISRIKSGVQSIKSQSEDSSGELVEAPSPVVASSTGLTPAEALVEEVRAEDTEQEVLADTAPVVVAKAPAPDTQSVLSTSSVQTTSDAKSIRRWQSAFDSAMDADEELVAGKMTASILYDRDSYNCADYSCAYAGGPILIQGHLYISQRKFSLRFRQHS